MAKTARPTSQADPLAATSGQPFLSTPMAAAIFFGLAFLYFLPALLPGQGIFGTDYLAGGYPFSDFIAGRLRAGELPKWVPYVYGGLPLFANAGSTFYPVWLLSALVFPVRMVLPVLFLVQFALAGLGMFLLLRELEVRRWAAFLCGLAFQFTGLLTSYVYAGHDGRVIVASLAPLFLFFLHRTVRTGRLAPAVGATATLAFCFLSFQIQSSYYLLLGGLFWGIFGLVVLRMRGRQLAGRLALGLGSVAAAFVLASVNFLPFVDYVDASPRGGEEGRGYEYAISWAMPPSELSSLAVPEWEGASVQDPNTGEAMFPPYRGENPFKLHSEYVGGLVLLLLGLGAWHSRRDRYWWFFLALSLFTLTIAFGGHTPIYRLHFELLPGTRRFRAPSISFFLVSMALVAMAGITLERLARLRDGASPGGRRDRRDDSAALATARWGALAGVGVGLVLLVAAGLGVGEPGRTAGLARFGFVLALSAGILWAWLSERLSTQVVFGALVLLTVADLWLMGRRFFHTVPPPQVWFQADDVVAALPSGPGDGRVWVLPVGPQYRGTGNYFMPHGIEQAGGEHPNPLQRWYEYVGAGVGHYVDWHNFLGESPAFRHAANIRWIVSMVQLEGAEQFAGVRRIHEGPSALVYEDPGALPRAYLVGAARVIEDGPATLAAMAAPDFDPRREAVVAREPAIALAGGAVEGEARILEWSPDRIRIHARSARPALLILADNYYPGWRARIGDEQTPVLRANHTFRAVAVPSGEHDVVFSFRPVRMLVGFWIYAIGMLALAGYGVLLGYRHWRGSAASP
jgi:uncharacterized membrane-anchored protein YitT (DUF2179 family)